MSTCASDDGDDGRWHWEIPRALTSSAFRFRVSGDSNRKQNGFSRYWCSSTVFTIAIYCVLITIDLSVCHCSCGPNWIRLPYGNSSTTHSLSLSTLTFSPFHHENEPFNVNDFDGVPTWWCTTINTKDSSLMFVFRFSCHADHQTSPEKRITVPVGPDRQKAELFELTHDIWWTIEWSSQWIYVREWNGLVQFCR